MPRTQHQFRAFTLVELLLVVAVITLLVALLLPALRTAREESRAILCAVKHGEWAQAFGAYQVDHQRVLPLFGDKYDGTGANGLDATTLWYNTVAPFMGMQAFSAGMPAATQSNISNANYAARRCPSDSLAYLGVHYGGFNSSKPNYAPINYGRNVASEALVRYATQRQRSPGKWMLLCDTNAHFIYTPNAWTRTVDWDGDGVSDSHPGVLGNSEGYYNRGRPTVHGNSGSYAFVDAHVERISFADWLRNDHSMWTGR